MMTDHEIRMMNKREFLRLSLAGLGGCLFCNHAFAVFSDQEDHLTGRLSNPDDFSRWTREALFYQRTESGVQCEKCPHGCILGPNESGICRNRVNIDGKLCTIAYGNPCAVHVDPIEKKPLFHFLPSTRAFSIAAAGCNLRCLNCQNWQVSQVSPKETENIDLMPERVVEECIGNDCRSIAYTYSEPNTFYEYALDTSDLARKRGIKNVWKSSGYINEKPLRRLCKSIDAANIDLKGFDDEVYRKLNGASLEPVLQTLKTIKSEGVWLEITNLIVPTWTDDMETIRRMCRWLKDNGLADCPLHFDRFMPLYKLNQLPTTPVSQLEEARDLAIKEGIQFVYIGNVPAHPAENSYCPHCGKMIIERRGFAILSNSILKGKCSDCGTVIPGVWN
ncbi:MAG TPA: AmmeMemoRadiSam system radical SAM enzyme [Bacteroidota bacterium]|nr:AmmeMemoRadiSam system radical SAM enzyme [Bacteroidota bacterium]